MSSKTLGLIFAYWTGNLKSEKGDGYIDLPFNIEKFCAANDELLSSKDAEIAELKKEMMEMRVCILEETQGDYSDENYEKFKERFPLTHILSNQKIEKEKV